MPSTCTFAHSRMSTIFFITRTDLKLIFFTAKRYRRCIVNASYSVQGVDTAKREVSGLENVKSLHPEALDALVLNDWDPGLIPTTQRLSRPGNFSVRLQIKNCLPLPSGHDDAGLILFLCGLLLLLHLFRPLHHLFKGFLHGAGKFFYGLLQGSRLQQGLKRNNP